MKRFTRYRIPRAAAGELVSRRLLLALPVLAVLSGCATTQSHVSSDAMLPQTDTPPVMLLMKPDVELSELTAGGIQQPHAQWTVAGLGNIEQALADMMRKRNVKMVPYEPPDNDPQRLHDQQQIIKLHRAVGVSIIRHKYFEPEVLPTKQSVFDWSLGPDVQMLREDYEADYALFVFVRDSYATAGRTAMIVAMAVLGVGIPAGTQAGFASLVDLRTGNVVWFNRLVSATGDLRTRGPAEQAVASLMAGFPL
ncbi:MAG: hypothetical protein R3286_01890 [Gammaproteobacteria bacterium]|nr:hypothetical protein [Gammaproteobacteria bacterium]